MCPKLRLAATALALIAAATAAPALAQNAVAQTAVKPPTAEAAAPTGKPASAATRAAADRLDPLARAAFWASEANKNPRDAEAGVKLATALRQLGRNQEAYDAAQQVLAVQPDNAEALLETARVAIADDQGFFAIAPMKKLQTLRPRDWRAPSLLGIAYAQTDQPALALKAHNAALVLAPDNPAVLCNLGMFFAAQGDRAQAETLLRKAANQPDATAQVRQDLALVLGLEGRLTEAEALQRQDLPPQMAENNIAYLKAATSPVPVAPPPATNQGQDHSWNAVAKAEDQAQTRTSTP